MARVGAILGRSSAPRDALAVRAVATRLPSGEWRVELTAIREDGAVRRDFMVESCDAAADATALIVSLMVDPAVAPTPGQAGEPHDPAPEAAPTANPAPPTFPAPAPPVAAVSRRHAPWFGVRASLGGDLGTVSTPNLGGELALAVTPGRLRFEIAGSHWLTSTTTLAATSEGAWFDLNTLAARAAYVFSTRDVALAPLVGVEVDEMAATGFGGSAQHHRTATYGGIDLGATSFWFPAPAVHALALTLTLEATTFTEKPPPFVATGLGAADRVVLQSSPVAARTFFGVECRFF